MTNKELFQAAIKAREKAYAPYSGFLVGAAVETGDGKVVLGCNIENASYPAGICAERTAIFKAISEGATEIVRIAVVGGKEGSESLMAAPCGICRQVMMEFAAPGTFRIILGEDEEHLSEYTLKELLPLGFGPKDLD